MSSGEDVCDVWLDMLDTYHRFETDGKMCTVDDLNVHRFLVYAVDMMKNFNDLVIGSLELKSIGMLSVLQFSDLILDDRLFQTLVSNVKLIRDETERKRQASIFFLIFEVGELKRRFYETFKQSLIDLNKGNEPSVAHAKILHSIDIRLDELAKQREMYHRRMVDEFADCEQVVSWCEQAFEFWSR